MTDQRIELERLAKLATQGATGGFINYINGEDVLSLIADIRRLEEALKDMLSGWKYIRETHGDLYGVGWDRSQEKAESALSHSKTD